MRDTSEGAASRVVRVFESVPGPGPIVKFIDEIVRHAPTDMRFSYFSWPTALFGRYDVFHVHWPEFLLRQRSRPLEWAKHALFRLLLIRLKASRIPVVRTVHNVEPHHRGSEREAQLLARLDALVTVYVTMTEGTPTGSHGKTVLIPHGDFRESFAGLPRQEKVPGRILLFGRIQAYKGVIELIRAAEEVTQPGIEVRIVGSPTPEMRTAIEAELTKPNRRGAPVSVDLRTVSDDEMIAEMTRASLIALPYRDAGNGNSGVTLLALSLDRPVLVPRARLMELLADETGPGWINMMDTEINGTHLEEAIQLVATLPPDAQPQLVGRDWVTIAESYAHVFRDAASARRPM